MTAKQEFKLALLRLVGQEGVRAMLEEVQGTLEVELANPESGGQIGADAYAAEGPLQDLIMEVFGI